MTPAPAAPAGGISVGDRVAALRGRGIDVEFLSFPGGGWNYPRAVPQIRRLLRRERFDLVHAHFGLAGWCASLAGAPPPVVPLYGPDRRPPISGPPSRRPGGRLGPGARAPPPPFCPGARPPRPPNAS